MKFLMKHLLFFIVAFCSLSHGMERTQSTNDERILDAICNGFIDKPLTLTDFMGIKWSMDYRFQYAFLKSGGRPFEKREEVLACMKKQAESGHAEALCNLGYYYEYVSNPAQLDEAERYYKEAAEKGLARGCYLLADFYSRNSSDKSVAIQYFEKAAQLGYEPARIKMAFHFLERDSGLAKMYFDKALDDYQKFSDAHAGLFSLSMQEKMLCSSVNAGGWPHGFDVLTIPYIYEKAAFSPAFALVLIKAGEINFESMIFERNMLAWRIGEDKFACANIGIIFYQEWKRSKRTDLYAAAIGYFKEAADAVPLAAFELGILYTHFEEDLRLNANLAEVVANFEEFKSLKKDLEKKGVIHEKALVKQIARFYCIAAAKAGHEGAKRLSASIKYSTFDDLLTLKALGYLIKPEDLAEIGELITQLIRKGQDCLLLRELCEWLQKDAAEMIQFSEQQVKLLKKNKQHQKMVKTVGDKFTVFKNRCKGWVEEIEILHEKQQKAIKDEEKRRLKAEKDEQKRALKAASKQQAPVSSNTQLPVVPRLGAEFVPELQNPNKSERYDSPQIGNRSQREDQPEIIPVKKEKIKTRPAVTNQPQIDHKPQEKTDPVARPPLIRQMSAVALVRKNSKTNLNDPKYKRLVRRLSCSDLIGKLKLEETDIRRTLEELAQRQLIDYRDEKTTITATKKNDHTVPLVIHTHGDWASNMDIVKQFLQFVYDVDAEYWQ